MNEADTCRTFVVPKLQAAGWENAPFSIAEQRYFTNPKGRVRVVGGRIVRGKPKRADYLLRYRRDFPIAVVEAKADYKTPGAALCSGQGVCRDSRPQIRLRHQRQGHRRVRLHHRHRAEAWIAFPTPEELWARLNAKAPLSASRDREDCSRLTILTLSARRATTSRSPSTAPSRRFCMARSASCSRWRPARARPCRLPDLLEALGRPAGIARTSPSSARRFSSSPTATSSWTTQRTRPSLPSATPGTRSKTAKSCKSREMYFAIYQAIAEDERRPGLYQGIRPRLLRPHHRGRVPSRQRAGRSNWREILEYFEPAVPARHDRHAAARGQQRDTYRYFGNPIYQYSLRQGIDDGFLAPYRVHRIVTDQGCGRLAADQGRTRPLRPRDSRRGVSHAGLRARLSLCVPRTEAIAQHLTDFLRRPTASPRPSSSAWTRNTPTRCGSCSTI